MLIECYNLAGGFLKGWWVKVILLLDGVLIFAVVVAGLMQSGRNAVINFEVTPLDAEVFLNGESGYADGEYKVFPGEYQVRVEREGLETREFSVNVGANEYVTVATFLADENGEFLYYELKDSYEDYSELREVVAGNEVMADDETVARAREFVRKFEKAYKIFKILPVMDKTPSGYGSESGVRYEYDILKIENSQNDDECTKTLCLIVSDTTGEKEAFARSVINKFGYSDKDYEIVYRQVDYE